MASIMRRDNPILITGCARSGTSLVAGCFDKSGCFGGRTAGPNANNKKGMFENTDFRNGIVKVLLKKHGYDPLGQKPLPDVEKIYLDRYEEGPYIRYNFYDIMAKHGLYNVNPSRKIYYKGAKMCLIWPWFDEAFPNANWIIVRRPDEDIIRSCMKTSFMKAYKTSDGWQQWVDHHKLRFEEMKSIFYGRVQEVWAPKIIAGDFKELFAAMQMCGVKPKPFAIKDFVEPKLFNSWEDNQ